MTDKIVVGTGRQSLEQCYSALDWDLPPSLPKNGFVDGSHGDERLYVLNDTWHVRLPESELTPKLPLISKIRGVKVEDPPQPTVCFEEGYPGRKL